MYLYFIRHAEPNYEIDSITETGHEQAKILGQWFKDIHIDELYHSSMGRAQITASYLAEGRNITPTPIDWARELCWGKANGDAKDIKSPWAIKDNLISSTNAYPEGDSWKTIPEFKEDNLIQDIDLHCKALDSFLEAHGYQRNGQLYKAIEPNEKTIVIVCHGGVISALVSYLTNVPFMQYISHMGVDLTAITKLHLQGQKDEFHPAQLIYVNSQSHLGVK